MLSSRYDFSSSFSSNTQIEHYVGTSGVHFWCRMLVYIHIQPSSRLTADIDPCSLSRTTRSRSPIRFEICACTEPPKLENTQYRKSSRAIPNQPPVSQGTEEGNPAMHSSAPKEVVIQRREGLWRIMLRINNSEFP